MLLAAVPEPPGILHFRGVSDDSAIKLDYSAINVDPECYWLVGPNTGTARKMNKESSM